MNKDAKVLEGVYYELTKKLSKGVKAAVVLKTLKDQASEILDDVFKLTFIEFVSENNQLARYILLKIEEHKTPKSAPLDWETLTLEHILAGGLRWEGKDQYLNRLGNYTLLSEPLNKEASNKEFKKKRDEYKKEKRIQLTKNLIGYRSFTKSTIIKRQKEFAALALEIWNPDKII